MLDGADLVAGVHLLSTLHTGHVSAAPGSVMAAADLFTLEILGQGGHGANPHETVDPVVVAAQVITNLQQIVSRETDPFDSVVVSVTTLAAGTARNVIPGSARIGGTVRTLSVARRAEVRDAMERVIAGVTSAHRAGYRFDYEVGYDPVVNDRDASAAVQRAIVAELGEEALVEVASGDGRRGLLGLRRGCAGGLLLGGNGQRRARNHRSRTTIRASTSTRRRCVTASPCSPARRSTPCR